MTVFDQFKLDGKVALVTGGAGLYGRQIAEALAEAGACTVIASRSIENLQRQVKLFAKQGLTVHALQLDQSDENSILRLRDQLVSRFSKVDVLVNNAVLRCLSKGWESDPSEFTKSMNVNITGAFLMTRAFGELMADNGMGSIINIGSIYGMVGPDFSLYEGLEMDVPPDYFAHKGALHQLTRYAAARLGHRGVRVNTISPGGFLDDQDPRFVQRYSEKTMLGRMANGNDLKGAIVFLASEASAYITSINLPIDAGLTAK